MSAKPIILRFESPISCRIIPKNKSVKFDICSILLDICKHGLTKEIAINEFKGLLTKCNYLEFFSPQKNMSLVHIACSYGHLDILEALLENSTSFINQQDTEGWSPAHCASAEGNGNILRLLGKYGPAVGSSLWDSFSETPLDLNLITSDGETIGDVSLMDKKNEISGILYGSLQVIFLFF